MTAFYFPLTLGRPRAAARDDDRHRPPEPEAWREGVRPVRQEVERIPEDSLYRDLLRPAGPGYTLVTGEPGAGKSTLLEQWLRRWADTSPSPRLGMVVPVLVRFRNLNHCAADLLATKREEDLALALWAERLRPDAATSVLGGFYRFDPRLWTPLWLLDGLDEAAADLRTEEFLRRLAHLPGRVCLSCRTAIAQSLRPALQPGLFAGDSLEIQPLNAREQRDFLTHSLGDDRRAATLHRRVTANTQMREVAGNPLLLSLIAQMGEEVELPASRAAFYERAVARLWTKVTPEERADDLRDDRDTVLTVLAAHIGLADIQFPIARLDAALKRATEAKPADLRRALVSSGLLRLDRQCSTASFLHLTFQEYFLARALSDHPFAAVLMEHWASDRHPETLALLLAMTAERDAAAADAALRELVDWGRNTHGTSPEMLWEKRRSPLRTALHLVSRSGHGLARFSGFETIVRTALTQDPRVRLALCADPATPPEVLVHLTDNAGHEVREELARNPATPPEILARLADDADQWIRLVVARNPATPPEILARLADDSEDFILWELAGNPAIPLEILVRLAGDPDKIVRRGMAGNPATPPEILVRLADDPDEYVRGAVAGNPATPPEILARLADAPDDVMRWVVALNPATPPEILARLADDPDEYVRWAVAGNPATPPEIYARLADDPDEYVRWGGAENPATPLEILARLAHDPDADVRTAVARNPATPPEILSRLTHDPDEWVGGTAVENPSLLLEDLLVGPAPRSRRSE